MNRWFWFCALFVLLMSSLFCSRLPSSAHEQFILLMCSCFCICADDTVHTCVMYTEEETQRCITQALRFYPSEFLCSFAESFGFACLWLDDSLNAKAIMSIFTFVESKTDRNQCQMSLLKNLTCKGTLRQVFYLSEAPFPTMTPYPPPPPLQCTVYLFTQGRGELSREKVGRKYQHDWLYL